MKTLRLLAASAFLFPLVGAAQPSASPSDAPLHAIPSPAGVRLTAEELEQLVAPIALYPDALIALILPAATASTDIVLAARHVRDNPNDRSQIEHRAWDESVKSLTHYPEVLKWMDDNLPWTKQLGEAFAEQPAEVMQAVQRLRAKARAAGTLVDTPQQQVIAEPQVIRIVPAQPEVIYVPRYDPEIVFVDRPIYYSRPLLTFGFGVPVGSWLAYDCDWRRNAIWVGDRHRRWTGHDWRRPLVPITPPGISFTHRPEVRVWRPPALPPRPPFSVAPGFRHEIVRPAPLGTPHPRSYSYTSHPTVHERRDAQPWHSRPRSSPFPDSNAQHRDGFVSPRPVPPIGNVAPPFSVRPSAPPAATPAHPPPSARRSGPNWTRNDDDRGRSYRGTPPNSTSRPTINPLPMTHPAPAAAPFTGPVAPRGHSRAQPATIPSLPVARAAEAPPSTGPTAPATAPAANAPTRSHPGSGRWNATGQERSGGGGWRGQHPGHR